MNGVGFFKDRHWILREFGELNRRLEEFLAESEKLKEKFSDEKKVVEVGDFSVVSVLMEVGCGVGNTFFPLLAHYFHKLPLKVFAFDFSDKAIQLIKQNEYYVSGQFFDGQLVPFVHDLSSSENYTELQNQVSSSVVDFCTCIFVLSAISPQKFDTCVRKIAHCMKLESGIVFIRDYARNDLAQNRFMTEKESYKRIDDHFYARGDGTCAYYFSREQMVQLFVGEGYFELVECDYCEKLVVNVKEQKQMERIFVQARFRRTNKPIVL